MTTTINNEHKKLNVPNLRFKEFQGEWEKYELNDICETITDFVAAGSFASLRENVTYYQEDNYAQLVRTIDLKNNFSNNEFVYVDKGAYDFLWRVQLIEPNIVLPNIGANIGEKYYVRPQNLPKDKNVLGPNAILLRSESNDTHFVYFRLSTSSYDNEMKKLVGASGQPKFNKTDLKKVKVFMPTISEQKKISRFLALIDERIATQNKIIEDLKKLKSAIIEKVFNGKHSEKLQLNDVGSYIRGLTYSSNDVVEHGGTIVMRSNNIINGSLLDYNNNVVFVNKQMSAEQQLQNGDVVICMANGSSSLVGKSSFYDGSCHSPITVGAFCGIYRSKEPIVKWLFQTNKYRRYIWNSLQGGNGAIANLNGEDILNMSFSIPNATIKDTCVKMLTSVDSALENNMSLCALYTLQKQHLLRQMFI